MSVSAPLGLGLRPRRSQGAGAPAVVPGPSVGDGLILEAGTDYLILETGDFILLE